MTDRRLKVAPPTVSRKYPAITLRGRWLQEAGFQAGVQVQAIVRRRIIVIIPEDTTTKQQKPGDIDGQQQRQGS